MIDLVRKRHEGDGWIVFTELANSTGFGAHRYADAFALGVWESTKHEGHLYEFKASRSDLRRELKDPTKVQGVGKYATYWWLVLEDEKIMADLVIPDSWGILVPTVRGGTRLAKVLRKAPKHKPAPFDPKFAITMIRNMAKNWVSHADHRRLQTQLDDVLADRDLKAPPDQAENEEKIRALERQLKELREGIAVFKDVTGVDLTEQRSWTFRNAGHAYKLAHELDRKIALGELGPQIAKLSTFSETLENEARQLAGAAIALRELLGVTADSEHADSCASRNRYSRGRCDCGVRPMSEVERKLAADVRSSNGHAAPPAACDDGQAGGGHCGHARSPEQDAGVQLRDQRDEVPHG